MTTNEALPQAVELPEPEVKAKVAKDSLPPLENDLYAEPMDLPIVEVHWVDSVAATRVWYDRDQVIEWIEGGLGLQRSVGMLIHEDDDEVVITSGVGGQIARPWAIPKCAIKKWWIWKEVSDDNN